MSATLQLKNGRTLKAHYDPEFNWYRLRGWEPHLGAVVAIDGIDREVVLIAELGNGDIGLQVLPDLDQPACHGCREFDTPRPASWCRLKCPRGAVQLGAA